MLQILGKNGNNDSVELTSLKIMFQEFILRKISKLLKRSNTL